MGTKMYLKQPIWHLFYCHRELNFLLTIFCKHKHLTNGLSAFQNTKVTTGVFSKVSRCAAIMAYCWKTGWTNTELFKFVEHPLSINGSSSNQNLTYGIWSTYLKLSCTFILFISWLLKHYGLYYNTLTNMNMKSLTTFSIAYITVQVLSSSYKTFIFFRLSSSHYRVKV